MTTAHEAHPLRPCFTALQQWAQETEALPADHVPALEPLLYVLPPEIAASADDDGGGSAILSRAILSRAILATGRTEHNGRALVSFDIAGRGAIGVRTRAMLPAHFAILRAFELIPNFTLAMVDETGRTDRRQGRDRDPEDRIYRLNLMVASRPSIGVHSLKQFVARTLFNAPVDASLSELYGADHRRIIPAHYIFTKRRPQRRPRTRDDVLAMALSLIAAAPAGSLPYAPHEMADLLPRLFVIADRLHAREIMGTWKALPNSPPSASAPRPVGGET